MKSVKWGRRGLAFLLLVVCLVVVFIGCGGGRKNDNPSNGGEPAPPLVQRSGSMTLPSGSTLNPATTKVLSFGGETQPDGNGNFNLDVPLTNRPQVIIAQTSSGSPFLLGYKLPENQNLTTYSKLSKLSSNASSITINSETTALALVMINPFLIGSSSEQRLEFANKVLANAKFYLLKQAIEDKLKSDPDGVLSDAAILQASAQLGFEVLQSYGSSSFRSQSIGDGLYIEDLSGPDIKIVNPKMNYYGLKVSDRVNNTQKGIAIIPGKESLLSLQIGLPPVVLTPARETAYDLGDGNFKLEFYKGFNLENIDEWANWNSAVGRATLYNGGKGILIIIDLVAGWSPDDSLIAKIADILGDAQTGMDIYNAIAAEDPWGIITSFTQLLYDHQKQIGDALWQYGFKPDWVRNLRVLLNNIAPYLKGASIGNKSVPFFWDLITADKYITSCVVQSRGTALISKCMEDSLYVSALTEGTKFTAKYNGTYKFMIISGAFEVCPPASQPDHPELWGWKTEVLIYKNRPIIWSGGANAPEHPNPANCDFSVGDQTLQPTFESAENIGKSMFIDITLMENDYVILVINDSKGYFWDNAGGISFAVSY